MGAEEKRQKILFFMHVPWGWVKQRPHFIAEHLASTFDVTACFQEIFIKRLLVNNPVPSGVRLHTLSMLRGAHFPVVAAANRCYLRWQLRRLLEKGHFDIIWLMHPDQHQLIAPFLPPHIKVVCDYMDDLLAFPHVGEVPGRREELLEQERALLRRSDVIFTSSEHLRRALAARHHTDSAIVVNNGISLPAAGRQQFEPEVVARLRRQGAFLVSYIGTVSSWFDFALLQTTVERLDDVAFLIYGPVETPVPKHERIIALGPIEHRLVFQAMALSDALVMPFAVNDLIRGVDPVKLYEYVFSGKATLAVRYGETEKFEDYVYRYNGKEEFLSLLQDLKERKSGPKKSLDECRIFAAANTWDKRVAAMSAVIQSDAPLKRLK